MSFFNRPEQEELDQFYRPDKTNKRKTPRWKDQRPIFIDMGPEYQKWLTELKEVSRGFNDELEKRFRETDLPITTKKEHANFPVRLTFQLRPMFAKSSYEEPKFGGERHMATLDEVTIFFHLNEDQTLDGLRTYGINETSTYAFTYPLDKTPKSYELKKIFDINNLAPLIEHIITRYQENPDTIAQLKKIYAVNSLDSAKDFFGMPSQFIERFLGPVVLRNASVIILNNLLSQLAEQSIASGQKDQTVFSVAAQELMDKYLQVETEAGMDKGTTVKKIWLTALEMEQQNRKKTQMEKDQNQSIELKDIPIDYDKVTANFNAQKFNLQKQAKDYYKKLLFKPK